MKTRTCLGAPSAWVIVAFMAWQLLLIPGCPSAGGGGGGDGEPQCADEGEACDANADCCGDLVCGADGVCEPEPPECAQVGEACDAGEDCCDGLVCGDDGVCAEEPPECVEEGGECAENDDCCEDLACGDDGTCQAAPAGGLPPEERGYVGTDTCLGCHGAAAITGVDLSDFLLTGHSFKLNAVDNGTPPEYPVTTLAGPPEGLEWDDVSFVIGGFRYKYRVMDANGYIVLGPSAQYNFPSRAFGGYDNDESHTDLEGNVGPWGSNIGRKEYDCGKCHTTGYEDGVPSHLGLEAVTGNWAFPGIHCEECHGPGEAHVASMSRDDIITDITSEAVCGKCHTRSPDGIAASGGFVKHHEQWDEFSRSVHLAAMPDGCLTCHDTHHPIFDAGRLAAIQTAFDGDVTAVDGMDPPPGIIRVCTDCHTDQTVTHAGPDDCKSCHMAYTTKTAVAINDNMGDIRSHAWRINTDPAAPSFTDADFNPVARDDPDLTFAALDENGQTYITLDFACLRCHTDEDVDWAATNAASIHAE
jgi:hypothetical protein